MGATCNICKEKTEVIEHVNIGELYNLKESRAATSNAVQKEIRAHGVLPHLGEFMDSVTNDLLKTISKIDEEYTEFVWEPQQEVTYLLPPCKYSDGSIYVGAWRNHKRQGNGTLFYKDGRCFQGRWNADEAEGFGRLYHSNGDLHQGIYKNSKPNGPGQYRKKSEGMKFLGVFVDDKLEGEGKQEWKDGTSFQGSYKGGVKSGYGKFKWSDGNSYFGNFMDNQIEGYGQYRWGAQKLETTPLVKEKVDPRSVRRIYRGEWKDGQMHGHGTFQWEDKRKYVGQYVNDLKEGEGRFEWGDGRVYEGEWKAGLMHGNGRYTDKYGTVMVGTWLKGCLVRSK